MHFDGDAFISYAHLDNEELVEGRKGWVANLHRALEIRVGQLLGKQPHIWRDPKLQGNDFFAETLVDRLRHVAVLVAVVSPRYIRSEWAQKELHEFWKAAEDQGGVRFAEKARVFKVLKTPVPLANQQPELRGLLGYEFFKVDPETGKIRELDEVFGPEAQREFWIKLDDLAHEICALLERLEDADAGAGAAPAPEDRRNVYLAETTSDLREQREVIRRDLQQQGFTVLPAQPLPQVVSDVAAAVRDDLARCRMSIHLLGRNYGLVPEGGANSLVEIQNELAIERGKEGTSRGCSGFRTVSRLPTRASMPCSTASGTTPGLKKGPTCWRRTSRISGRTSRSASSARAPRRPRHRRRSLGRPPHRPCPSPPRPPRPGACGACT